MKCLTITETPSGFVSVQRRHSWTIHFGLLAGSGFRWKLRSLSVTIPSSMRGLVISAKHWIEFGVAEAPMTLLSAMFRIFWPACCLRNLEPIMKSNLWVTASLAIAGHPILSSTGTEEIHDALGPIVQIPCVFRLDMKWKVACSFVSKGWGSEVKASYQVDRSGS